MNFHPDKQLFQIAGAGDRTTDPSVTKPVLISSFLFFELRVREVINFPPFISFEERCTVLSVSVSAFDHQLSLVIIYHDFS